MRFLYFTVFSLAAVLPLGSQPAPPSRQWSGSLGAMLMVIPLYAGSNEYRLFPIPAVEVSFRDRVTLGASRSGIGFLSIAAFPVRTPRFDLAVVLTGLLDRPTSRADALAGMSDLGFGAGAGVGLGYRVGRFQALTELTRGVSDAAGAHGTVRASYAWVFGRLVTVAGVGAVFVDGERMRREFGITDEEAAARELLHRNGDPRLGVSDLGAYSPGGGLRHLSASFSVMYPVSKRWLVLAFGDGQRLSNEAAASPLVRSRWQLVGGTGIAWQF